MLLKFLQLNIYHGRWLPDVVAYIKKEEFDIIHFQEVSTGKFAYAERDNITFLQKSLSDYDYIFAPSVGLIDDPKSDYGVATFYKKFFNLKRHEINWWNKRNDVENIGTIDWATVGRNAISIVLEKDNVVLTTVNTHLAWSKTDKDDPNKLKQGRLLYEYIKKISPPFIISGDFNVSPTSHIVQSVETIGINLIKQFGVRNTLNPRFHRSPHLFPTGLAVDYIFPSPELQVKEFTVLDDLDLSDHLGLVMECEI